MPDTDTPQLYLISPPDFDLSDFPSQLAGILDTRDIACVRLALATQDEDRICRAADALRDVTHTRDVALVIETHFILAERLGLDGVHLMDGPRSVRRARTALGTDAIVGSFCGVSRHDAISAGESGVDYVSLGPVGATSLAGAEQVDEDLFAWWSEVIELPVVAEGGLDADLIARLAPVTDFFAIGEEIWGQSDPGAALGDLLKPIS